MPHIVLEHNLEDEDQVRYICKKLHGALSRQETVKLESIKTRAFFVSSLVIGDGTQHEAFAHVTLKLLKGRSEELKQTMGEALLEILKGSIKTGSIGVEVAELQTYLKA